MTWDATTGLIEPPIEADADYVNTYSAADHPGFFRVEGNPTMPGSWTWSDDGLMGEDWPGVQGLLGGMGKGSFDFYAPINNTATPTSVWVQCVSYIPNAYTGLKPGAEIALNNTFTDSVLSTTKTATQIHELDATGSTGDWWRITEMWNIDNAGDLLYLRDNADVPGTANIVDSVQLMTKAVPVPVPGAIWPLASGILGLVGIRRNAEN